MCVAPSNNGKGRIPAGGSPPTLSFPLLPAELDVVLGLYSILTSGVGTAPSLVIGVGAETGQRTKAETVTAAAAGTGTGAAAATSRCRRWSRRLRLRSSSWKRRRRHVRLHTRASSHARRNIAEFRLTFCPMRSSYLPSRNSCRLVVGNHWYVRSPKNTTSWCVSGVPPFTLIFSAAPGRMSLLRSRCRAMPGQSTCSTPLPSFHGAHTGLPPMKGSSVLSSSSAPE
mmetsp:Transcript_1393/g.3121  ORF Transcript_1393/g.3121 Transcript_1393/m.3121 type:complete len:227 (-) Transcript_1393:2642-3322(-)